MWNRYLARAYRQCTCGALAALGLLAVSLSGAQPVHADVAGLYALAQGGTASRSDDSGQSAFGYRLGGHLAFIEAYHSLTLLGPDQRMAHLVLGPRLDFDIGKWNLILRAGVGGAAFSGPWTQNGNLSDVSAEGVVGRAGLALERALGDFWSLGLALETEAYALETRETTAQELTGSTTMLTLQIKFELGID
jgi:hypothetical protein